MELSEAIRLGSMLHAQAFGDLLDIQTNKVILMGQMVYFEEDIRTCALGAAFEAIGKLPTYKDWRKS